MKTLNYEEQIEALNHILATLQDAASRQTDDEWRKYGNKELSQATQLAKRLLIQKSNEYCEFVEQTGMNQSLGLDNMH